MTHAIWKRWFKKGNGGLLYAKYKPRQQYKKSMIDLWKNFSNKNIISSFVWAWYSLKVLRQINGVIKTHWEVVIDANKPHNVKFSTFSFFYRWSYGIVMWEVFTIGMWNTLLRGSGSTGQQEAYYSQFSVSSYMLFS